LPFGPAATLRSRRTHAPGSGRSRGRCLSPRGLGAGRGCVAADRTQTGRRRASVARNSPALSPVFHRWPTKFPKAWC
jgi:hypothetical protein